jgi:hypothetical protein
VSWRQRLLPRALVAAVIFLAGAAPVLEAQGTASAHGVQGMSGTWVPISTGRGGVDPKVAPPPPGPIVLKPAYAKEYEARRARDAEATRRGEPTATAAVLCTPYGMPRMMSVASYPVEVLQTPGQITIVTEAFSEVRRVYLDQPQLPIDEVPPGFYGHSVGRWEGDTLVIDTVGIKEAVPGYSGLPHSDRMRIVERMRLVAPDVLHDEITIHDPIVLDKPVTYTLAYRRLPNYKMVEFVCENNREYIDEQGRVRMKLGGSRP